MARKPLRATPTQGMPIPLDEALRNGDDNFIELYASGGGGGGGAVASVNGQTGVVVLDAADVGAATSSDVTAAVAALVDSSPGTLDTLNELAAALGDDPNFATTIAASIAGKQPIDSDLTAIAGLAASNDDLIQRKAGTWINRTMAQVKTDLAIAAGDLATIAAGTILGNNTGGASVPLALTAAQVKTILAVAAGDISGLAASATTDTTNASNIGSGTLADGRLSANVPLLNAANTYTAIPTWSSTEPRQLYNATGGGTNGKLYDWDYTPTLVSFRSRTDADGAGVSPLTFTRTASSTAITNVTVGVASVAGTYTFPFTGIATFSGSIAVAGAAAQIQATAGTAALPSLTFSGDPNTGFYSAGADIIGVSTGGVVRASFQSSATFLNVVPTYFLNSTSVSAPPITNGADTNTGILFPGADRIAITTGGVQGLEINATQKVVAASGFSPNAGGLKHSRVTTGSVGAGSTALVTITWTTPFADANYTPIAAVLDSTTSSLSLSIVHVESWDANGVSVRVINNAAGSLTGTLLVTAIHD